MASLSMCGSIPSLRATAEPRIPRLHGFAAPAHQDLPGRRREVDAVAPHDAQRIGARRWIGHRGTRGNVDRPVAWHVRDQQRDHARRMARRRQPAALDGRQVPAHAIHLADRGARLEEHAIHRLLVVQSEAGGGQRQQGRAAARYQAQDEVVLAQILHGVEHALRRPQARGIGNRMRGLGDFDVPARNRVTISRDDEARQRPAPMILHGPRHGRGRLARADDDHPAAWRGGEMRRDAMRRLRGTDCGIEHPAKKRPRTSVLPRAAHGASTLTKVPIPSIDMSTEAPSRMDPTPSDVPQAITSPGSSVMS